jgi:hypothetical protein
LKIALLNADVTRKQDVQQGKEEVELTLLEGKYVPLFTKPYFITRSTLLLTADVTNTHNMIRG